MGISWYVITLSVTLGFSHAIYFNATDFNEEYICDIGDRTLGICSEFSRCMIGSSTTADCGIDSAWMVCCPKISDKRLPAPIGIKSRQKCREYADKGEDLMCPLPRPFNGTNAAMITEFPHMAALGYKLRYGPPEIRWLCAGSLISELYVLTEHLCASGAKGTGRPRRVRLGDVDLSSSEGDEYAQEILVKKVHRLWKNKEHAVFHNVALIRLATAASFNPAVRPACLHVELIVPSTVGVVAGWGKTSNYYGGSEPQLLRKADLNLMSWAQCDELYDLHNLTGFINAGVLTKNIFLCAFHPEGRKDTCRGDGGAPLMVKLAKPYCTYSIVGVVAFGSVPCGQRMKPSAFTRIYHYIPWIEKIVWPDGAKLTGD